MSEAYRILKYKSIQTKLPEGIIMLNSWLVLTPPIVVLALAFITKRINLSLIVGILCSALIASNLHVTKSATLIAGHLWLKLTDPDVYFIYIFLILIGSIITLIIKTGGAAAFAKFASKKIKNKKMAETSSLFMSFCLFIDDYLSNSTVGYIMRPLTDQFKVARTKLAFLVHSIATPLVVLAPISGWSAMITNELRQAGVEKAVSEGARVLANPYLTYIKSIPFIFYSFLMLASVWFIVRLSISYGPMAKHEQKAQKRKAAKNSLDANKTKSGSLRDLIIPLLFLMGSITIATVWAEKLFKALNWNIPFEFFPLFLAGAAALTASLLFAFKRKKIKVRQVPSMLHGGYKFFIDPIIMLFLASILGALIRTDLETGIYLANMINQGVSIALIPLMLFGIAAAIAIATGTSWGTIAIMVPITIPMVTTLSKISLPAAAGSFALLLPAIGAILAGAVCGDHISPVSETTIMAANSAGAPPIDHAITQFFYALPALVSTCIAFLISGLLLDWPYWVNIVISGGSGLVICLTTLYILGSVFAIGANSDKGKK